MSELTQGLTAVLAPTQASHLVPPLLPASAGMLVAAAAVLLLIPPAVRLSPSRGRPAEGSSQGALRAGLLGRQGRRRGGPKGSAQNEPVQRCSQAVDAAGLLDLTGALLSSGVGIEAALDRLAACVPGAEPLAHVHRSLTAGTGWETAWSGVGEDAELRVFGEQLAFAHATGAPTVELLQTGARQARAAHRQQAEQRAARLGVQMVIPLGICFLPAFVLLGVVPVVLALVPESLGQMG